MKGSKYTKSMPPVQKKPIIGEKLDFAATEAYKMLRTNLMFSLPAGSRRCKVIGVTSSVSGEGKTTTSINLSYALAETGKRVLLIDADLRLPTVDNVLELQRSPGLSNVLTGMSGGQVPIQKTTLNDSLFVITSGDIPPNPSELLGAKTMDYMIRALADKFDYVVLDLPPVTIVSDALVISPLCDGVLVIVRQGYTNRREAAKAVELLQYGKAKVLGFVLNEAVSSEKSYSSDRKAGYYRKNEYAYSYGSYHTHAADNVKQTEENTEQKEQENA